jgi:thiaminase
MISDTWNEEMFNFFSIIGKTGINIELPSVITSGTEDSATMLFMSFFLLNFFSPNSSVFPSVIVPCCGLIYVWALMGKKKTAAPNRAPVYQKRFLTT